MVPSARTSLSPPVSPAHVAALHAPFFESLAALSDESSLEWRRLSAGVVCLRLIDAAFAAGWARTDAQHTRAAWRLLGALDASDRVRGVLASLLRVLEPDANGGALTVRPRLMAYGRVLEMDSGWSLAGDVYAMVVRLCGPTREAADAQDAAAAWIRLGECRRQEARWDEAHGAFAAAIDHAAGVGNLAAELRARCLDATVTSERGNLPRADAQLRRAARAARAAGLADAYGLAMHGRAHVAYQRRRFESAVRFAFRALRMLRDPLARDRALADVATSFAELGVRDAARDAHLILVATTQDPLVRGAALVNLMELAAIDRMEPLFEQYRRQLAAEALPPRLGGYYHYFAGRGAWQFGRVALARTEYARAAELSAVHGLAQLGFEVEEAVRSLGAAPETPRAARAPSTRTAPVARALGRMRAELSGAAS